MKAIFLLSLLALTAPQLAEDDPLRRIMTQMQEAACCRFEFISILESEIFESVDSAEGLAYIAEDGRYRVSIGPDEYIQTVDKLYSYSRENNQVTVEEVGVRTGQSDEIPFITRLDEFYDISVSLPGDEYLLHLMSDGESQLPEQMRLEIDSSTMSLRLLEFRDVNDDLNRIAFTAHRVYESCDSSLLQPDFPDSVEVIRLY
jgi:outer membrane lipoprotein-sorting protein